MATGKYSFESIWNVVSSVALQGSSDTYMHSLDHRVEAGTLRAAADGRGRFCLLVPLLASEALADQIGSGGVHMSRVIVEDAPFASIRCSNPELNDVFIIFVQDLVDKLPAHGPCAGTIVEHVEHWRDLFAQVDSEAILGLPQVVGLLAELQTLEKIVCCDPARRLSVWTGPLKSQHDFRSVGSALEVKATLNREGYRTRISSLQQLNAPDGAALYLSFYKYQLAPKGDSLPAAVRRIKALGVDTHQFDKLLLRSGYRSAYKDLYAGYVFETLTSLTFDVNTDGFPRIVPGSFREGLVPNGVEQLSYVIDLAVSMKRTLHAEDVDEVHRTLAQGGVDA